MVQIRSVSTSTRNQQKACTTESKELLNLLSLQAGSLPTERIPAPLYLVAVLDKSGSMSGSKIDMLKDTIRRLIARLRPIDTLTLIAYDTDVDVILPPTLMTKENADKATQITNSIRAGTSTNMSGGLIEGLNNIPSDLPKTTVVSTLLLTDGLANIGVKDSAGIIALMNHTWDKENAPTKSTVYTFGYGSDHDSEMLRQLADAGNGMYYYIENGDKISDSFADVLGGLMSVVAQNIVITLEAQGDTVINEIFTEYSKTEVTSGKKFRIQLADIQSEEARDIPIRLHVPAIDSACSDYPLLHFTTEFYDCITNSVESEKMAIAIPRKLELSDDDIHVDVEIDAHVNRIETCAILKEAKKLGDSRQFSEARRLVKDQIVKIQASVSAELPMCVRLIQDLNLCLETLQTESRYQSEGSHRITNFSNSHSRQRAAPQGYDMEFEGFTYCNSSRFECQSLY